MEYDIIVAGVGGMGSATVAELAARGARVLGLDRAGIPNDSGSSHGVNRIIRLACMEDPAYVPLLHRACQRWRDLETRLGEPILVITGGVDVGLPDSDTVSGALASVRIHGLEHELLDAPTCMDMSPSTAGSHGVTASSCALTGESTGRGGWCSAPAPGWASWRPRSLGSWCRSGRC